MTSNPIIKSIGVFIPKNRVSNVDFLERFAITDVFLNNKLGIQQRTIKNKDDKTSDLCLKAFNDLCDKRKFDSAQIELVCVVTQNPDQKIPLGTVPDSYQCLTCDDKLYMNGHDVLNYALKEVPWKYSCFISSKSS